MPRSRHLTATVELFDPDTETRVLNETTGEYDEVPPTPYDTVPGKVQPLTMRPRSADAGETLHIVVGYLIAVPRSVTRVKVGHRALVSNTRDALLDGRLLNVDELALGLGLDKRFLRCSLID